MAAIWFETGTQMDECDGRVSKDIVFFPEREPKIQLKRAPETSQKYCGISKRKLFQKPARCAPLAWGVSKRSRASFHSYTVLT
jgi:hypothetical protein